MAKENPNLSYNNIPNLDIDWESIDPSNNKPWSGASIERVIKSSIKDALKQASESSLNKIGAQWFDPSSFTMYHFKNVEDKRKWEESGQTVDDRDPSYLIGEPTILSFAGTLNRIQFVNPAGTTTLYFTTNANEANITVGFESQEKGITDTEWKEVSEDFVVSVSVDRGALGSYETFIADKQVLNGNTLTFDVRRYLATGSNRIKVTAKGVDSGAVANLTYQVTLTSMYLSPSNFTWYTPFIEGKTYNLGGMNIGGNLEKTLFVKVTKEGYEKLYEVAIGTNIYTDTAYIFKGLEFPEAGTGVYNVDIWLEAGTLQSEHLSYNIICVKVDEQFTAKVVSIGNPTKVVYNFSDNELFEYCVYNGGQSSASPHLRLSTIINTNPNVIVDEDLVDVATSTPLKYVASLEVESQEAEIQLEAYMQYGNEQQVVFPIDNSKAFPATSGAVFYLNPSTRSNAQENKLNVVNAINSAEYTAEWNGMAWTDGMDGWTIDEEGRKCLRLPAFTNVNINYQPLSSVTAKTIEFVYKVKNASDYSDAIITICDDASKADFKGIKITPKNILVHSSQLNTQDSLQDYNAIDEEVLSVIVTIIPNYKTNYGNLCQIYCNGEKVRSFEYANSDSFATSANIIMGNDTADLFLYKMRVYNIGFEKNFAMKNFVNSLPDRATREAMNAELNSCVNDSMQLDYDTCVKNGYNTMVIEMLNGKDIPSLANQEAGLLCNLQIKINNIIEGELDEEMEALLTGTEIKNEVIEGQGTTAMTYPRWNFRWKLSKAYGKRRITAKKNVASSMQSHKMGATRLYNYLYSEIIGKNEVGGKVAVLQYPVFGFKKSLIDGTTNQYVYTPIGLYTIGADKGDKHTFGYDNAQYKNSVMHLEGADHTPKSVGFDYPYEATKFSSSAEAMGAINTDGTVIGAWEVGMAGKLENNVKADEEGVQEMLDAEWKPAYNVAYHNSPYVMGVSETIASINANVDEWRKGKTADDKSFTLFEIYNASDYALHYYDIQTKQYKPTGVNVLTDVGLTASAVSGMSLAEIDAKIIELRKARFVAEWGTYFHTDDAILHYTFCLIFGVTDNFKKNTYPYKFPFLANGGKWRWRVDDLDTLFDVINQGLATKQPDILVGDTDATGSIYVGDTSVLWTLIKETQTDEIKAMAHKIFSAMVSHPLAEGANTQAKLVGCIKHFFWDFAQNYFPASAYNVDVEWTYEDTWANKNSWKEVNPLSQALGGHFEAEKDWVTMRMLFMSSYFNFGAFTHTGYNDASTGQMVYGGADAHTFEITSAVSINPTIIRGSTETITYGDRVKANETASITVSDASGDDTRVYVQGLDYIKDLGDLKDLKVSAKNPTLSVASKRLQSLKVGDADASKVPTSGTISNLSFGDCPSLMVIDAQNLGTLVGAVDLSLLPRLKEALFGGTNVKTIGLPSGSKIERFQIPDSLTALDMQNLKFLGEEGFEYGTLSNIEFFRIENCDNIDKFALLKAIYLADGSKLKNIRVVGFNYEGNADDVTMVANMAIDKDKDGNDHSYNGINQEGQIDEEMLPVIEGRLKVNGSIYEDDGKILKQYYPNLTLEVTGGYYVKFADAEVRRICAENWGDGVGITSAQVEAVNIIDTQFTRNTKITTFNELEKFIKLTAIVPSTSLGDYHGFNGCTSLQSIRIPNSVTELGRYAFAGCIELSSINLPTDLTFIGHQCFYNCKKITNDINLPKLATLSEGAFYGTAIERVISLGAVTIISGSSNINYAAFANCKNLKSIRLLNKITEIGVNAFNGCTSLEIEDLNLPNLTSLGQNAFYGVKIKKISNLGKITEIPDGGTNTSNSTFGAKDTLESIILPETLLSIGRYAFMRYNLITEIIVPNSVTTISLSTFQEMYGLKKLVLGSGVTTIGQSAIRNTNGLESLVVMAETPPTLGSGSITGSYPIYVPNASVEVYKSATNWSTYADRIYPMSVYEQGGASNIIEFEDPAVEAICLANWDNNKDGYFTKAEAASVTSIGAVFNGNTEITSFDEFEKFTGVTRVGTLSTGNRQGFYYCSNLSSIKLPNSAKIIGYFAFDGCSKLTNVALDNVEEIYSYAFYGTSVEELNAPKLITLEGRAFKESNIQRVVSLGEVDTIKGGLYDAGTFQKCTKLESVNLKGVKVVESYAFDGCESLHTLLNAESLESIAAASFRGISTAVINMPSLKTLSDNTCFQGSKITRVDNLGEITELADGTYQYGVFFNCTNLTSVVLPTSLTKIGSYAFSGCSALASIEFGNSIKTIGQRAFYNCASIEIDDLSLPNLESLGQDAFYGVKVKKISNLGKLTTLPTAFTSTQNFGDKSVLEEIVLPPTITTIPQGALYKYSNAVIEDLNLPNLTSIGNGAFNSTKLKKISSLGSVTRFNDASGNVGETFEFCKDLIQVAQSVLDKIEYLAKAFKECENLEIEELKLPNLTRISAGFSNCNKIKRVVDLGKIVDFFVSSTLFYSDNPFGTSVELIIIPDSVTGVGRYAFQNSTSSLRTIILKPSIPPSCETYWSNGLPSSATFYVPDASVEAYKTATNWSQYSSRIKGISELPIDNPTLYNEIKDYLDGVVIKEMIIKPNTTHGFKKTLQLTCIYKCEVVTPQWTVDGDATIDANGLLSFKTEGEATVTATYNGMSESKTYYYGIVEIVNGVTLDGDGNTSASPTMSTVGFVPIKGATTIKWGVTGGTLGLMCEYKDDGTCVDYWGASANPRTVGIKSYTTFVKASFSTEHLANAYIMNATTGEYLWKGENVE